MEIRGDELSIARVLHESDDFITLEIAKTNDTSFTLNQDSEGNVVGDDIFYSIIFMKVHEEEDGVLLMYKPWED